MGGIFSDEARHEAYSSIITKKTKYILQVRGHEKNYPDRKCSKVIPYVSLAEMPPEEIGRQIKDFEGNINEFEELKLYRINADDISEELSYRPSAAKNQK